MRRSEANQAIRFALDLFQAHGIALPPFAHWPPTDPRWDRAATLIRLGLGWDVTDFGSNDFLACGLTLFTLRNGGAQAADRPYAEKIMAVREAQVTPTHFHHKKMEDIIVRAGAPLCIEIWNNGPSGSPAKNEVAIAVDSQVRTIQAGSALRLEPGESVTLPPGLWHRFYALGGPSVVGEISTINDDAADNVFLDSGIRFPQMQEDEPPLRRLVADYPQLAGAQARGSKSHGPRPELDR